MEIRADAVGRPGLSRANERDHYLRVEDGLVKSRDHEKDRAFVSQKTLDFWPAIGVASLLSESKGGKIVFWIRGNIHPRGQIGIISTNSSGALRYNNQLAIREQSCTPEKRQGFAGPTG